MMDIHVLNVSKPLLQHVIWRDMLKVKQRQEIFLAQMWLCCHLKIHIESKHEKVRNPRLQCDYVTTQACHLKQHVESKHEGVKYHCSQCNYAATKARNLKRHVEAEH